VAEESQLPPSSLPTDQADRDLGWMLHDITYPLVESHFFRARLEAGVLDVQKCLADGVVS
jgi:CRISPR-associated protein Cas5d